LVQTNALFQKNALVSAQLPIDFDEKETVYEKMNDAEKKKSVFLSLTEGKHFSLITLLFLV
jgi:hypothetical protein